MLSRLRAAGLVVPALMLLPALAVLIGLGTWQLERKAWKEALIARIEARTKAPPVGLGEALRRFRDSGDVEYLRVRAEGRLLNDRERYFYAPDPSLGPGYDVYTPLVTRSGSGCSDVVLVNRGYVPESLKAPGSRAAGELEFAAVVGLVRLPGKPNSFIPANDVARNIWFWRDLDGLWASLGLPKDESACTGGARPYPFLLDAEAKPANPGGWPKGGATNVVISNRHLEYVLTWYGLAAALIAVFVAFAYGRLDRLNGHKRSI